MVAVAIGLAVTGHLAPHIAVDTPQYLRAGQLPWPGLLGVMRLPIYGWIVQVLSVGGSNYALLPSVQIGAFFAAVFALYRACLALRLSRAAALSLTVPIVFSNLVLFYTNYLIPEIFGAALVIFALSRLPYLIIGRRVALNVALYALALIFGCLLRPIYLLQIFAFPILLLALSRLVCGKWNGRLAAVILAAGLLPFLVLSTVRAVIVSDFNIVSFGGYAMSGISGQMIDRAAVSKLPADLQPMATRFINEREALVARGELVPPMPDAPGRGKFLSRAVNFYDVLVVNYNVLLWRVTLPMQGRGESWVDFNRRMLRFSTHVILALPKRYAGWVLGGMVRFVGVAIVLNVALYPVTLSLLLLYAAWIVRRPARRFLADANLAIGEEFHAVMIIAGIYTLSAILPPILIIFPANRYIECASLFLVAIPAYPVFRHLEDFLTRRSMEPARRQIVETQATGAKGSTTMARDATLKSKSKQDEKVDEQSDESFPASDPPSYAGGKHAVGAPKKRETPPPDDASKSK